MESGLSNGLRVQLPTFEGPLDLLLYLVRQEEVDLYNIPIEKITKQYLEYLELMQQLDLEIAGEFLVVAATLVYIKSRLLLPKTDLPLEEEEEEINDPRWELIRQLVEYKKFKEAAAQLGARQDRQEKMFGRGHFQWNETLVAKPSVGRVGILELMGALHKVLARIRQDPDAGALMEDRYSVSDKILLIQSRIASESKIKFSELFQEAGTKTEVVVTFLAILELIRQRWINAIQSDVFGEIDIVRADETGAGDSSATSAGDDINSGMQTSNQG